MRVMFYPAGCPERLVEINGTPEALRDLLGGPMELTRLDDGMMLVARADDLSFLPNREVWTEFSGEQMICGSFAVCGRDAQHHLCSLPISSMSILASLVDSFSGSPRCVVCGREGELAHVHGMNCCLRHVAGVLRDWTREAPTGVDGYAG